MAILTFRVQGQTLTVESEIDRIVENSVNYLDFKIIYDDEKWDPPLAKKVVVTYDKKTYEIFGNKIPSQVIHAPGFTVSVIGYKSDSEDDPGIIITTYPVAIKVFPSGATKGSIPEDTVIDSDVANQLNEKIEDWISEFSDNLRDAEYDLEQKIIELKEEVNEKDQDQDSYINNIFSNIGEKKEGADSIKGLIQRLDNQVNGTSYLSHSRWEKGTLSETTGEPVDAPHRIRCKNALVFMDTLNFISFNERQFCIYFYNQNEEYLGNSGFTDNYSIKSFKSNNGTVPAYFKIIATYDNKDIENTQAAIENISTYIIMYHRGKGLQASMNDVISKVNNLETNNKTNVENINNIFSNIGQKREGKDSIAGRIKRLNIQASGTDFITPLSWTENGVFDNLPTYPGIGTITNKVAFENPQLFNERLDFLSYNGIKFCIALYRGDGSIDYTDWVSTYSFTPHENDTIKPVKFMLIATNENKEISDIEYITSSIMIYHRNQGLQASVKNIQSKIQDIEKNYLQSNLLKTLINNNSTDSDIPTAKAVVDYIKDNIETDTNEKLTKIDDSILSLEERSIKYLTDINVWELSSGFYCLGGTCKLHGSRAWRTPINHGAFVAIRVTGNGVKYIRLSPGATTEEQPVIEYGYTDGNKDNCYYYNTLDTNSVISEFNKDIEYEENKIYSANLVNEILQSTKEEIKNDTIKTFTEQVNIWELKTGIYYLKGGYKIKNNLFADSGEKHIFFIYKPIPSKDAVRYIHFCGQYRKDGWSSVECGYTDGTTWNDYAILDSSKTTTDITKDTMGVLIPNSTAVKNYAEAKSNKSVDLEADRENTEKYPNVADILQYIDKGAIKTLENPRIWQLETGVYYALGSADLGIHSISCGKDKHIFIVFKLAENEVKYLHLCGGNLSGASPIKWGYSDGTHVNSKEYAIIDTSDITDSISEHMLLDNNLTTARAVMDYVKVYVDEVIGGIENGSY